MTEHSFQMRQATEKDLPDIVKLLGDDELGKAREDLTSPLPQVYLDAFMRIHSSSNIELLVIELDGEVRGCLQLTLVPCLARQGAVRAQIEAVKIASTLRGQGLGKFMFNEAIKRAKGHGATMVELTSDNRRPDAHRFYEDLGFVKSHAGFKLEI